MVPHRRTIFTPFPLLCLALFCLTGEVVVTAADTNGSLLTLKRIYDSSEFSGETFSARWLEDGSGYQTWETSKEITGGRDLVRNDPRTGKKSVLVSAADFIPPAETAPLRVEDYAWSKNRARLLIYTNSKRVWRANSRGDYWVLDPVSHELFQLGGDVPASTLMFAKFSPDGNLVAYVRERNIYVQDLRSRQIISLTRAESPDIINGTFDWVNEEEFHMRDGFRWSPDGKAIAYWQINTEGVREMTLINHTDGLYPKTQIYKYPKAGEVNSAVRIGVVEIATGSTRWLRVPGDPRNNYLVDLDWPEHSPEIFVQQFNRLQNTNLVLLANPATGDTRTLLTETDAAWVSAQQNVKWLDQDRRFIWASERDGWSHLYQVARDEAKPKLLTRGNFDVTDLVHVDEKGKVIYLLASPDNAAQRYLYRVSLNGGTPVRVTPKTQSGSHSYQVSPDGKWAIHTFSSITRPPVTDLISLPAHKTIRVLVTNKVLIDRLAKLKQPVTEFFRVPVTNGVELDGWCIKPPDMDPAKKYPLLVYVYGEPAGQSVRDQWGGKSLLWHWMLAQEGYVVMSFDNRGTPAPRGRDWRKAVYRQVGILAPEEQAAAVKHVLATRSYLDATRVGIWGWSGGGSMTLNALLKHPELYQTGIAVASVPNRRYYDSIYEERYMGLPADNVEGYKNGSPINFASGLKGNLLVVHGTGDDNVHYQGFEALVNEFIKFNKPFQMMSYPNRSHSISEGVNTSLHLRTLMTKFLNEKLPAGGR
jgi:dipeptidyl-peptidase-4